MKGLHAVIGIVILGAALGGLYLFQKSQASPAALPGSAGSVPAAGTRADLPLITVKGKIGGEKWEFINSIEVRQILEQKYGITVEPQKAGSIEMLRGETNGLDFLWPGSRTSAEVYRGPFLKIEEIFNSPIVFMSRGPVVEALMRPIPISKEPNAEGRPLVEKIGDSYYITDFERFVKLIEDRTKWSEIGLPALHGSVKVLSTHPGESNSGNAFAGLVATTLNGGEAVETNALAPLLPRITSVFARMGRLERSSGTLFDGYLGQGMGAYPIIVGYENQLIELALMRPGDFEAIKREMRVIYPRPTTWSNHPMIALTAGGKRLIEALQDPQIQKLAWERHGFRTKLTTQASLSAPMKEIGLAPSIDSVVPMPTNEIMTRIVEQIPAQ